MIKTTVTLVGFVLLWVSCQNKTIYQDTKPLDANGWEGKDFVSFSFTVEDTINAYQLDLYLRNDEGYAFSNLFLFIQTIAPTGASIQDTIECTLADKGGKWLGKGIGGKYQYHFPYKKNIVFPYVGKYVIEVEHGMRTDPLLHIEDVGLSIKRE